MLARSRYPVGLELYSVRTELQKDLPATVTAVAKLGFEVVEFFAPYYSWTPAYASEVRRLLDDLGLGSRSSHNSLAAFAPENLDKTIDLNLRLGNRYVILAGAGPAKTADDWRRVAEQLNAACEKFRPAGLRPGFHNHSAEFRPFADGARPIDIVAQQTRKEVVLQLDVGTCVEARQDPVAFIQANPGRFASLHLKEYSSAEGKGYRVLFGDGDSPWRQIFSAAEAVGGVEYYLIEQEEYYRPEIETAGLCLENFRKIHA
jgi:sugar phosphate isomerase/epimerase